MKNWKHLPLCFSYVAGLPSGGSPITSTTSLMVRFENARVAVTSTGCTLQPGSSEGITGCVRSSAGKTSLTFAIAWPKIPNCTLTPEGEAYSHFWVMPSTTTVGANTYDTLTGLQAGQKQYGDQNYAIRCSGTQQ